MTSKAPLPRRLALALGVLVAAVLAAEVAHRLWFYGPAGLSPARLASVRPLGETGFNRRAEWPRVGFRLKPGIDGWFKLARFRTNSEGWRDREYARAKPAGTFRVAVVGDSFTMGSGVALEETYHALLEERLNAAGDGVRYELVNFGVGGYDLLNELGIVEHALRDWDPDLILLALTWNDAPPADADLPGSATPEEPRVPAPTAFWRLTLFDRFRRSPRERPAAGQDPGPSWNAAKVRAALGPDAPLTGNEQFVPVAFGRIRELCSAAGARVFCVYLSTGDSEDLRAPAAQFEPLARAAGFGFLDTCPLFAGLDRGDVIILPNDGHPNARAHALYAAALERALREGGWLSR